MYEQMLPKTAPTDYFLHKLPGKSEYRFCVSYDEGVYEIVLHNSEISK